MTKLKLGPLVDDKPVKVAMDLPGVGSAGTWADLDRLLAGDAAPIEPAKLSCPCWSGSLRRIEGSESAASVQKPE